MHRQPKSEGPWQLILLDAVLRQLIAHCGNWATRAPRLVLPPAPAVGEAPVVDGRAAVPVKAAVRVLGRDIVGDVVDWAAAVAIKPRKSVEESIVKGGRRLSDAAGSGCWRGDAKTEQSRKQFVK